MKTVIRFLSSGKKFNPVSLLDIIEKFVLGLEFKKEWNDKTQKVEKKRMMC